MSKPGDYFQYRDGVLETDGVPLDQIAEEFGTPLYVYSARAMLEPLEKLKAGLRGIDASICFALKSNSNLAVIGLLSAAGAGADVVSGGELFRAKQAEIPSDQIVFSGVGKTPDEIREALLQKIQSFNVESSEELASISRIAEQMGARAQVALRFNPDVDAKTHPYVSTGLRKNKFGLQRREVLEIVRRLRAFPGVSLRGISIHIGSQLLDLSPLSSSFERLKTLALEIEAIMGKKLDFLDLGGGVGISYGDEKSPTIEKYCALIQKHFGPRSAGGLHRRIMLEPGRLITGNAGVLISRVIYRKERKEKDFLVLDAGMNDLLRPALYGSFHDIVPLKRLGGAMRKTDVVGPVCESADCFASDRRLPKRLRSGDLVAILSTGAYGFTMASNYNTRPRSAEVLVQDGARRLVRARETYEDLIRGEQP